MRHSLVVLIALLLDSDGLSAQRVSWNTLVTLYGDNTEFFTPFREGATILGGQFSTTLEARPASQYLVLAGVHGDVRWGSPDFLDEVRPILSFRYQTPTSLGVIGTLRTERRHGFLEALAVTTLELTRPIEYGLQWIERRKYLTGEIYLNWQALNTAEQREVFDYGWVVRATPIPQIVVEHQLHGLHHGGQLFDAGVPVTNNVASALGVTLGDQVPVLGKVSLGIFRLRSSGNIDPAAPSEWPDRGRGTLVRATVDPLRGFHLTGIHWWGRDFIAQEGDPNYGSIGYSPGFFRSKRRYLELGILRRAVLDGGVELDAEFRLHRIDDEPSIAIRGTSWEYSYRLVVRTPLSVVVR